MPEQATCKGAFPGWWCSRPPGHHGPCPLRRKHWWHPLACALGRHPFTTIMLSPGTCRRCGRQVRW